jgi:hypothetical protein
MADPNIAPNLRGRALARTRGRGKKIGLLKKGLPGGKAKTKKPPRVESFAGEFTRPPKLSYSNPKGVRGRPSSPPARSDDTDGGPRVSPMTKPKPTVTTPPRPGRDSGRTNLLAGKAPGGGFQSGTRAKPGGPVKPGGKPTLQVGFRGPQASARAREVASDRAAFKREMPKPPSRKRMNKG